MHVHERAAQIWPVLADAAKHRQTLTYTILGQLIHVTPQAFGQLLEPIQSYCILKKIPPLTAIVVNQEGRPSSGFTAAANFAEAQERVFRHDWLEEITPSPDELKAAAKQLPSCGVDRVTRESPNTSAQG